MIDFTCIIALFLSAFLLTWRKDWSKLTNPAEMWDAMDNGMFKFCI